MSAMPTLIPTPEDWVAVACSVNPFGVCKESVLFSLIATTETTTAFDCDVVTAPGASVTADGWLPFEGAAADVGAGG